MPAAVAARSMRCSSAMPSSATSIAVACPAPATNASTGRDVVRDRADGSAAPSEQAGQRNDRRGLAVAVSTPAAPVVDDRGVTGLQVAADTGTPPETKSLSGRSG